MLYREEDAVMLTDASADTSHSTIATCSIEKTIIKFRGSFSPSKYATSCPTKSGSESCICRRAWKC